MGVRDPTRHPAKASDGSLQDKKTQPQGSRNFKNPHQILSEQKSAHQRNQTEAQGRQESLQIPEVTIRGGFLCAEGAV